MANKFIASILALGLIAGGVANAAEQNEKPLRLLVGFSAGGGTDQVARLFGDALQKELKQPVIVENKTGVNGVLATQELARAAPDGNTIMIAVNSLVTNELLYKDLSYNVANDIAPISMVSTVPFVLTTNKSFPAKSVKDLIAFAKSNPGKVTYGSAGVGSPPHLFQELFDDMAGISTSHVPYRGSAPAMADLLGGHIDLLWLTTLQAMPYLKEDKLQALSLSASERSASVPSVPTTAEAGIPGYHADMWWGFVAPADVPPQRLGRLEQAFRKIVSTPEMQQKLAELGSVPVGSTSEEFRIVLEKENDKWAPLIKAKNITLDNK